MDDKGYRLNFEPRREYLLAVCDGRLDAETDRLIDEDIRQECIQRGFSRVLIDIRKMQGRLTMLENFQAGASFGTRLGRIARRIAIVEQAGEEHLARSRFFELVATNRNAFVKFFDSAGEAEEWLSAPLGVTSGEKPVSG
ncbi:MAG TPA: STAS/SEC14 domain-containing protein [Gammaproteobacteria bacterium]|nr:STAS/SEC14 domain-containing protein [Gammaproteobacteria bacterium]